MSVSYHTITCTHMVTQLLLCRVHALHTTTMTCSQTSKPIRALPICGASHLKLPSIIHLRYQPYTSHISVPTQPQAPVDMDSEEGTNLSSSMALTEVKFAAIMLQVYGKASPDSRLECSTTRLLYFAQPHLPRPSHLHQSPGVTYSTPRRPSIPCAS